MPSLLGGWPPATDKRPSLRYNCWVICKKIPPWPMSPAHFETMSLDDFEELILDMPTDEKWELIGGRVIRGMVGARWEHNRIVQNIASAPRRMSRPTCGGR
jgi:hypothetical protein